MKKILLVFAMIVCMTTCFVGGAFAQGAQFGNEKQIQWKNYSVSAADAVNQEKGVYLCCMTTQNGEDTYRFVNAGGDNGTLAILGNRGLRFDVESNGNGYRFKSSIKIQILITENILEQVIMERPYIWTRQRHGR